MKIKVVLVGCGAVVELLYLSALKQLENENIVELVSAVDPNESQRSKVKQIFPNVVEYKDLNTMLNGSKLDLAIIATPHKLHLDNVEKCLLKGINVLCEKPMAITVEECKRMNDASKKSGKLLAIGHFRRFFPSCILIKQIIENNIFGKVKSFRFLEGELYSWPARSASFFNKNDAGGGVLIDAGAHTIDLLLWWFGEIDTVIYEDDSIGGVEANCKIKVKIKSGAEGFIQMSRDVVMVNKYTFYFEKGWITYFCDVVDKIEIGFNNARFALNADIHNKANNNIKLIGDKVNGFMDCFVDQLRNVVDSIKGKSNLVVSGAEAIKSVDFIQQCYKSKKLLEMNWLNEQEQFRAEELINGTKS